MNKEKLLKIANHLSYGKLEHDVFSFINYNTSPDGEFKDNNCGTHGCAIGELPRIFPKDFAFVRGEFMNIPVLLGSQDATEYDKVISINKYLDLNENEYNILFIPYSYKEIEDFNYKYNADLIELGPHATRYEVASNIRKFIRAKEKYEKNS